MFQLAESFPGTPAAFVAGPGTTAATIVPVGPTLCVDVKLCPLGAARLFGPVLNELAGRCVDLDDLLGGRHSDRLLNQLAAGSWDRRLWTVEGFLSEQLAATAPVDSRVAWSWRELCSTVGAVPIADLVATTGWSHRHFVQQFRRHIGMAPKAAGRLIRLAATIEALQHPESRSLAELAVAFGYHDQAHMSTELHQAVGISPGEFRRSQKASQTPSAAQSPRLIRPR